MTTLTEILESCKNYSPEYGNALSNHLPMAAIALHRLGASDERLRAFCDDYVGKLRAKEPWGLRIDDNNWRDSLGLHIHEAEYAAYFGAAIARDGVDDTLHRCLPELWPGVSGSAFHPMIRLAFALESANDSEVAEALSAWAIAFQPLDGGPTADAQRTAADVFGTLEKHEYFADYRVAGTSIASRIKRVCADPEFCGFRDGLADHEGYDAIAQATIEFYLQTANFTALHLVTGLHAFANVQTYLPDPRRATIDLWNAFVAAAITVGPHRLTATTAPGITWGQICEAAIASDNDHAAKFVYTCKQQYERYGDDRYRAAAALQTGLAALS